MIHFNNVYSWLLRIYLVQENSTPKSTSRMYPVGEFSVMLMKSNLPTLLTHLKLPVGNDWLITHQRKLLASK